MQRVEFRVKRTRDIGRQWTDIEPVTLAFDSRRVSVVDKQASTIALAMSRGDDMVHEVRWSHQVLVGLGQGHYVRGGR